MRVDVRVLGGDLWHRLREIDDAREDVVRGAGAEGRERGGEALEEEGVGVEADAERAAGEEEGDDGRAEHLELAVAVWVAF